MRKDVAQKHYLTGESSAVQNFHRLCISLIKCGVWHFLKTFETSIHVLPSKNQVLCEYCIHVSKSSENTVDTYLVYFHFYKIT